MAVNEPNMREWMQSLMEPGYILKWAMSHYIAVCYETVFKRGQILAPLLQPSKVRDEAFGRFWVEFTSNREETIQNNTTTTTRNTPIQGSSDLIPPLLATASGTVLDIGPGTGSQLPFLHAPGIRAIYGPEPCIPLHQELRARVRAEGLEDTYTILPCGVSARELLPALQKHGMGFLRGTTAEEVGGIFDTIVCVRVLCSVPDLYGTLADLYALLKPGGKLLVVEHVVNPWRSAKGSLVARLAQALYTVLGWSLFVGDCRLNRDTERALRSVAERDGGWELVELERWFGRTAMPYISGTLVKKRS